MRDVLSDSACESLRLHAVTDAVLRRPTRREAVLGTATQATRGCGLAGNCAPRHAALR